jgi:fumarate hydratase subunit alpha
MREIDSKLITDSIYKCCVDAAYYINEDVLNTIKKAKEKETDSIAKNILSQIIENDELAKKEFIPMCQDTGVVLVFVEIGRDVHVNNSIDEAINEGVRKAYTEAFLRKSVVKNPIDRINTNDNTPAIIYYKIVDGDKLKLSVCLKGAGSENMSKIKMLNPSDGIDGIKKFIVDSIIEAGGRPCPPLVLGIGIGGTMDKAALMSKEALLRDINDKSDNEKIAKLEAEIFDLVNATKVGPMGLKGDTTCLAVKINYHPCHIASLPVALTIQCHAHRHKEVIL